MIMASSNNGSKLSLYDSLRQNNATALVESLQAQLKQREGEISQLQARNCFLFLFLSSEPCEC
jgi:cell division protein FtsB